MSWISGETIIRYVPGEHGNTAFIGNRQLPV
jgi:hypothetical protein